MNNLTKRKWMAKLGLTQVCCPKCGSIMLERRGPFGKFLGCMRYPVCKGTRHIYTGQDNTPDPTASDELKKLRMKGHRLLNKFCEVKKRKKQSAYRTLAKHMDIIIEKAHFGMFNERKCKQAVEILEELLK